jgi:hypothetical protein
MECVAVPANPKTDFGAGGRYVDVVQANAYQSDDWVASINPGVTDLLAVRLKPDTAAIAIAGFAVETDETLRSWTPIVRRLDKTEADADAQHVAVHGSAGLPVGICAVSRAYNNRPWEGARN